MKSDKKDIKTMKKQTKPNTSSHQIIESSSYNQYIQNNKQTSIVEYTFNVLDSFSRYLNQNDIQQLQQGKVNQIKQMFDLVHQKMTLREMHHLEYSNRLYYIKKVIQKRSNKTKIQLNLLVCLEEQIKWVQQNYFQHFEDIDDLLLLKQKYITKTNQNE